MKKIYIINDDYSQIGGVQKVTRTLFKHLQKNYHVTVVSLLKGNQTIGDEDTLYLYNGDLRIRGLITQVKKPLRELLKKEKPDCIIAMGTYAAFVSSLANIRLRIPFIYSDHGAIRNQLNDKLITMMRFITCKFSSKTVTLTKQSMDDYHSKFMLSFKKLIYIYNPIEPDEQIRQIPFYPHKKIMSVTRFSEEKGIDMLIDVARMVFQIDRSVKWYVYGDGPSFNYYCELVKNEHLDNQLILMGSRPNLSNEYEMASLFVLTSYREGLPIVLLESLAKSVPMISFDVITGPREIINNDKTGYLIPCYDKKMMSQKIIGLLEDEKKLMKMSSECQKYISKFDVNNIISQWVDLIENVTEGG